MRLRGFAAIVAVALTAAACTSSTAGHPHASTSPAPTPRASTTTSSPAPTTTSPSIATTGPNVRPGEKPPVLSDLAKTHTNAGADTYAQFWFHALDWAYATTDPSLLKQYSAKSCTYCAVTESLFTQLQSKHEHCIGGRLTFRRSMLVFNDHRFGADLADDITIGQRPLRIVNAAGKVVEQDPRVSAITFRLWLKWVDGSWSVVQKGRK